MAKPSGEKLISDNRRARHDYHLLDRFEAGVVLAGTEVKSLREGKTSLQQAYADVREGEAWLLGVHIPEYLQGNRANHDPDRPRKLLLHRREIDRLYGQVREKGVTIVPTRLYFKDGRVKVELALAKRQGAARQAARHRRPRREAADGARAGAAALEVLADEARGARARLVEQRRAARELCLERAVVHGEPVGPQRRLRESGELASELLRRLA